MVDASVPSAYRQVYNFLHPLVTEGTPLVTVIDGAIASVEGSGISHLSKSAKRFYLQVVNVIKKRLGDDDARLAVDDAATRDDEPNVEAQAGQHVAVRSGIGKRRRSGGNASVVN